MSLWKRGNLRNTPSDIFVDSVLLVAVPLAYAPLIARTIRHDSAQGLSPYFLFCNAIFSNIQFAHTLLDSAYAYPSNLDDKSVLGLIGDGRLRGFAAFGGILGLLQVAMQWACSMIAVAAFAISSHTGISIASLVMVFPHCVLFVLPALIIALPKPTPRSMGPGLFVGFTLVFNTWVALLMVLYQFLPQYLEWKRMSGQPGVLSLRSLVLQMVVLSAIAVRWFMRRGSIRLENAPYPPYPWNYPWYCWPQMPVVWYQWGDRSFNYILHSIGCAMLLILYHYPRNDDAQPQSASEETPLLA